MFITFEGPEGAGKSTLIRALASQFAESGTPVLATREPGAGDFGAKVRGLLLEGDHVDPRAELFLFLADRAQHMASTIGPALDAGVTVFCDRHIDSTVVYQGYGRGFDREQLRAWNAFATGGRVPDLTLLIDIDPALGLSRITNGDRLDREPLAFHERIRAGFLAEAEREPARFRILDGSDTPEGLQAQARRWITP
jgi:dTMP kinase